MFRLSPIPSLRFYHRFYVLVVVAVVLLFAVLTGSLVLGDSVRGTLTDRVHERLGTAETVVASGTGFFEEEMLHQPLFAEARGYLLVDGFVSVHDKLIPVYVWGTDIDSIAPGEVLVNVPLASQLEGEEDFVLHLPSHSLIPSGTLFVTKSYATQMRLHLSGVKDVEHGGNLLLKNEQTLPLNVFVNRQQLGEIMELEGKLNIILSDALLSEDEVAEAWTPQLSGIHLTDSSLTSDRIFIQDDIVRQMHPYATYLSYLVNDIILHTDTVPYSFVTAVDRWHDQVLMDHDIILSDYASACLHASVGDTVRMSYFLSKDLKNLETNEQLFRVKDIVPLADFQQDSLLITEFPGLSNVERCTDWDSDLPIKMDHIHKADEDYWYRYHQTPKAIVALDAVRADWVSSFGSATALRLSPSPASSASQVQSAHEGGALAVPFSMSDASIVVKSPKAEGLYSAGHGTDFASLFLALGFFIIVSALLLMCNPLVEMYAVRQSEIQVWLQLGFPERKVRLMLFREAFGVMLMASPLGVLAGLAYSELTLWLLGSVWSGATHTEGFSLHVQWLTLLIGWLVGLLLVAFCLWYILRKAFLTTDRTHVPTERDYVRARWYFFGIGGFTLLLVVANFFLWHSMIVFIIGGFLWIIAFGMLLRYGLLRSVLRSGRLPWSRSSVGVHSIFASQRQHTIAYWTLSLGVFTVFAVGLNRPDFSDKSMFGKATGGYHTYIDFRVPLQYDLNHPDVRHKLSLLDLPDSTEFLHFLRHVEDEASCFNLNKVATPTVLAVPLEAMRPFGIVPASSDAFSRSHTSASSLSHDTSASALGDASCPEVYVDSEALIWSMMKSVGDTLYYTDHAGASVPVVIRGTYPTGIFHGNAIMSPAHFRSLWPEESGVDVLLVKSPHPAEATEILSVALSEYGLYIQSTEERIEMFFEVTRTYLIIFLTLGVLGMLLGIFSLIIIIRKNLTAQLPSLRQYAVMGFSQPTLCRMLVREHVIIPIYAIFIGAMGSVISISANFAGAGPLTLFVASACLLFLLLCVTLGVRYIITRFVLHEINLTNQSI